MRLLDFVQELPDVHHLQGHQSAKEYNLDTSPPWFDGLMVSGRGVLAGPPQCPVM